MCLPKMTHCLLRLLFFVAANFHEFIWKNQCNIAQNQWIVIHQGQCIVIVTLTIFLITELNLLLWPVDVSYWNYGTLLFLLYRYDLSHISIFTVKYFIPCSCFVKSSCYFEFTTSCQGAESFTSITNAPFFITLILMSFHETAAHIFKFWLWDSETVINYIET